MADNRVKLLTNPLTNIGMPGGIAAMGNDGGLNKSARFAVFINIPNGLTSSWNGMGRELVYLCEAAEMPGRAFMSIDARYYGPSHKLPYQTQYEDTTMTFLCRAESRERQFFDDWMEYINPTNSFDFKFRDDYSTDIEVRQLTEVENVTSYTAGQPVSNMKETYRIIFRKAYPVNINPQPMTWADDQYLRLAVTFTYFKWTRPGLDAEPAASANNFVNGDNVNNIVSNGRRTPINFVN